MENEYAPPYPNGTHSFWVRPPGSRGQRTLMRSCKPHQQGVCLTRHVLPHWHGTLDVGIPMTLRNSDVRACCYFTGTPRRDRRRSKGVTRRPRAVLLSWLLHRCRLFFLLFFYAWERLTAQVVYTGLNYKLDNLAQPSFLYMYIKNSIRNADFILMKWTK